MSAMVEYRSDCDLRGLPGRAVKGTTRAKLTMVNIRMFTPSRERLTRAALRADTAKLLPYLFLVEQVTSLPFLRSVFCNVAQRVV